MRTRDGGKREPAWDSWAEVYDLADGDRTPDLAFYCGLVGVCMSSILELGCGTGTVTIPLARELAVKQRASADGRVVGIDESPEMLRIGRKRGGPGIAWMLGDLRSLPVTGPFDLVVCCYISFQYLLGDGDLAQAFREVRRVIAEDGVFAFDIYQPNHEYLAAGHVNRLARMVASPSGNDLELREDASYDARSRILTIDWRLVDLLRPRTTPLARLTQEIRQYFPNEVEQLLATAGFVIEQRFGDLDRSPFTPQSRKQVYVCSPGR